MRETNDSESVSFASSKRFKNSGRKRKTRSVRLLFGIRLFWCWKPRNKRVQRGPTQFTLTVDKNPKFKNWISNGGQEGGARTDDTTRLFVLFILLEKQKEDSSKLQLRLVWLFVSSSFFESPPPPQCGWEQFVRFFFCFVCCFLVVALFRVTEREEINDYWSHHSRTNESHAPKSKWRWASFSIFFFFFCFLFENVWFLLPSIRFPRDKDRLNRAWICCNYFGTWRPIYWRIAIRPNC